MRSRISSLRSQLAAVMILAIMLAILFGYIGLNLFGAWREGVLLNSLSAEARATYAAVNAGSSAPAADILALYKETRELEARIDHEEDVALVVLAILASIVGVGVGLLLANRLARPIEAVSRAARAIALGNLTARAKSPKPGAGELATLMADFNQMAESLQAYELEIREGSAAIAHELRTPLTVLKGQLQAHLDGVFEVDVTALKGLQEQVDLLVRIVEDLGTLSLANTGRLELRREWIDLALAANISLALLASEFEQIGIRVESRLQYAPASVDPDRFRQILLALMDNARRYAASGGVICVETGEEDGFAVLRILDRGAGIATGDEDLAFNRFWRAESSRGREHGGSGLGLAVVKAIAEIHGGDVKARRREGGGTAIIVRFPKEQPLTG